MVSESSHISARRFLLVIGFVTSLALSSTVWAEDPKDAPDLSAARTTSVASHPPIDEAPALKEQLARQQARIERLERTLEAVARRLDQLEGAQQASTTTLPNLGRVASTSPMAPAGVIRTAEPSAPAPVAAAAVAPVVASAVLPPAASAAPPISASAALLPQAEAGKPSPLSFQIGDAEFTPGGFLEFSNIFRTTNLGSGVATSFGTIPYSVIGGVPNTAGRMTEFRSLAQASRFSLKMTSKVGDTSVAGDIESDFAGNNPSSLYVTSNSSTLRLRHYYVQLMRGKFELVGGQAWTLMTPGRAGISPWSNDLFISQVPDCNYQLGITWGRQGQLRLVYHPNKEWAAALSIENPNQYISTGLVLPGTAFTNQFDMAGNQTTTPNLHPDIVAKVAYDPTVGGKHLHAELGGIVRSFRTFNPGNNTTLTITGGGVTAGLNVEVVKNLHLLAHGFYSDGGGRYALGLGPDVIVKPDGTLSAVHSGTVVTGFEYQMKPQIMLFGYYGGIYFQRNTGYTIDAAGKPVWVGFGAPASATVELNANRAVQEPTLGLIRTFWKSPKYGSLLWVNQYSYVTRAPWIVPVGSGKNAHMGDVYSDLRYVLP